MKPSGLFLGVWAASVCLSPAWGVNPTLDQILPRGALRGATIEVTFHGSNLADAIDLLFHEPGISLATITAAEGGQVRTILSIAPDALLGTHAIRVRTRTGLSNLRLFSVGCLAEVQEAEPNNEPETAQPISLGSTLNGAIPTEDVDTYAVELQAGQRIAVEVEALRLGVSLHDAKVRLFGPQGHERVAEDDTPLFSPDPGFVFTTQESGRHWITISESAYGGDGSFYYRLHVGEFPRPFSALPLGGVSGATQTVTWYGDTGIATQTLTLPPVEVAETTAVLPATEKGISPTPFKFRVSPYPSVLEVEPNNEAIAGTTGTVPGAFEGKIETAGDIDYFNFAGKTGQRWDLRVWARGLGSPLDSVMRLTAPSGGEVAGVDDSVGLDSSAKVTLPEDGVYRLSIRDQLDRGGDLFTYRAEVFPVSPAVRVTFLENEPVSLAVPRGNRAYLLVSVGRDEFGGVVSLDLPDLPAGLSFECEPVPDGLSEVPVVIRAATDAPLGGSLQTVRATCASPPVQGGVQQEIILVYGQNLTNFFSRTARNLALAVTDPAPFELQLVPPKVPIVRNGKMQLQVVARRAEGFAGAIDLRFPWAPPGIGVGTAQIPAGATETLIAIDRDSSVQEGVRKFAVVGTAEGYKVCSPLIPITMQNPWITFSGSASEMEQGKTLEHKVTVQHRVPFEGAFAARLAGLPRGAVAPDQTVDKDTQEIAFQITAATDAQVVKGQALYAQIVLEATGEKIFHHSEAGSISLFEPLPPTLEQAAPAPSQPQPDQPERKTRFPKT